MRGDPRTISMRSANTVREAVEILASEGPECRVFAGGTDLMVEFDAGRLQHIKFINISGISELCSIVARPDEVIIGSMATYTQIHRHPVIIAEFPNLAKAAMNTGGPGIQNRGTLGGNIANGSPAADSPPALISYGAVLDIASIRGVRQVPYDSFHLGYKKTALASDEIICSIRLPRNIRYSHHFFAKVGTRNAQAISKVVLAGTAIIKDHMVKDIRIGIGSVGPTVCVAKQACAALNGKNLAADVVTQAVKALDGDISPIDDIRSTGAYRQMVCQNTLRSFLRTLA